MFGAISAFPELLLSKYVWTWITVSFAGSFNAAKSCSLPPSTKDRAPLASWLGMQIRLVFPAARTASTHRCATGYHLSALVVGSFWIPNHTFGLSSKVVASLPHRSAKTAPFSSELDGVMLNWRR